MDKNIIKILSVEILGVIFLIIGFNVNASENHIASNIKAQNAQPSAEVKSINHNIIDATNKKRVLTSTLRTKELDMLISSNEKERRKAYLSLFSEVTTEGIGIYLKNGKDLLSYLTYNLSDPNEEFAHFTAAVVHTMAVVTHLNTEQGFNIKDYPYINQSDELKLALIDAIRHSSNMDVKDLSAKSLALGYDINADIVHVLIEEFKKNTNNDKIKKSMLSSLLMLVEKHHKPVELILNDSRIILLDAVNDTNKSVSRIASEIINKTIKAKP